MYGAISSNTFFIFSCDECVLVRVIIIAISILHNLLCKKTNHCERAVLAASGTSPSSSSKGCGLSLVILEALFECLLPSHVDSRCRNLLRLVILHSTPSTSSNTYIYVHSFTITALLESA